MDPDNIDTDMDKKPSSKSNQMQIEPSKASNDNNDTVMYFIHILFDIR